MHIEKEDGDSMTIIEHQTNQSTYSQASNFEIVDLERVENKALEIKCCLLNYINHKSENDLKGLKTEINTLTEGERKAVFTTLDKLLFPTGDN